jgi:hypothetical protein
VFIRAIILISLMSFDTSIAFAQSGPARIMQLRSWVLNSSKPETDPNACEKFTEKHLAGLRMYGGSCLRNQELDRAKLSGDAILVKAGETLFFDVFAERQLEDAACEMKYLSAFDETGDPGDYQSFNETVESLTPRTINGQPNTLGEIPRTGIRTNKSILTSLTLDPETVDLNEENPIQLSLGKILEMHSLIREIKKLKDDQIKLGNAGWLNTNADSVKAIAAKMQSDKKILEQKQEQFALNFATVWNIESPFVQAEVMKMISDDKLPVTQMKTADGRRAFQRDFIAKLKKNTLEVTKKLQTEINRRKVTGEFSKEYMKSAAQAGMPKDFWESLLPMRDNVSVNAQQALAPLVCSLDKQYGTGALHTDWVKKVLSTTAATVAGVGGLVAFSFGAQPLATGLFSASAVAATYRAMLNCKKQSGYFVSAKSGFCKKLSSPGGGTMNKEAYQQAIAEESRIFNCVSGVALAGVGIAVPAANRLLKSPVDSPVTHGIPKTR